MVPAVLRNILCREWPCCDSLSGIGSARPDRKRRLQSELRHLCARTKRLEVVRAMSGLVLRRERWRELPATPGAPHKASSPPTDYTVKMRSDTMVGAQLGWCWCEKCQGLFYAGSVGHWGVSHPPGIVIPPPGAYDFVSAASRTFAHSWLFSSGGAIAYFGENEVMEYQNGTVLLSYMLAQYVQGARSLGTIWHKAHQQYFQNFATNAGGMDPNFTPPRIYLGIMEMFGDPSLRLR